MLFVFNDTATTEIYTYLTHSFPTRRSSDLEQVAHPMMQLAHQQIGIFLPALLLGDVDADADQDRIVGAHVRSEEHTSELQSLMRISYAVFCLKNKKASPSKHLHYTELF